MVKMMVKGQTFHEITHNLVDEFLVVFHTTMTG